MPVSADVLRAHIDYTTWASMRLLNAAAKLSEEELTRDFGTSEGTVLDTMVHIFAADRIWLARIVGDTLTDFTTPADFSLAALQTNWPPLLDRWKDYLANLTAEQVESEISYKDLKHKPWTQPLWQLILHVVNHGTHHRGQIAGFLRILDREPPALDLVVFYRQMMAGTV